MGHLGAPTRGSIRDGVSAVNRSDWITHLERIGNPPRLRDLQALSAPRQANALRHWLASTHDARPSAAQLEELLSQVAVCTTGGHRIELKAAAGRVTRQGPVLVYLPV